MGVALETRRKTVHRYPIIQLPLKQGEGCHPQSGILSFFFKRILCQQLPFTVTCLSIPCRFFGNVWWSMVAMLIKYDVISSTRSSHFVFSKIAMLFWGNSMGKAPKRIRLVHSTALRHISMLF